MEHGNRIRLQVKKVTKTYCDKKNNPVTVVDHISFDVYDNELLVILGPGKCGKSVLLNMITGLLPPDEGEILLDGRKIEKPDPEMGMVFQKLGLMPWLTVEKNVEFGLNMKGVDKKERKKIASEFIDLVGLTGFGDKYPSQLSGGMKQRVGLARAYANNAKLLLLDEPFGQLDAQTRYNMQNEIIRITNENKRTMIFVTNNIEEALSIGDRIILLSQCPACVKKTYDINLPKPRDELSEEFLRIRKSISDNMDLAL